MGILNRFKKQQEEQQSEVQVRPAAAAIKAGAVGARVILSPVVTEKSALLASQGQYVFHVEVDANKIQIKNAIRTMYGVTPVSVNVFKQEGKQIRYARTRGQRKAWKKAMVTLPKGKTIEVYEGV